MQFKTITLQKLPSFVALGLAALLTSCGSYQYVGYDNDGIYSSDNETEREVVVQGTQETLQLMLRKEKKDKGMSCYNLVFSIFPLIFSFLLRENAFYRREETARSKRC